MSRGRAAALTLLLSLLLAGCCGTGCNLAFENGESVAVGQVELMQEGASWVAGPVDGGTLSQGEGVGFLVDPDDGPVTLRVWDRQGCRVLVEGCYDLDFSGGAAYTVTLRGGHLAVERNGTK